MDIKYRFVRWTCPECKHRNFTEPLDICQRCGWDPLDAADHCDGCDSYTPGATCCGDCEDEIERARRLAG